MPKTEEGAGAGGAEIHLDFDDEVVAGACITRDGQILHEAAKATVEKG